ncbi:MAG: DUF4102 domain-containing protein [Betaproteobacteria bacterium]|nr:DUF4102 domain-containing protein [Betaproteobacteria bacterium]
MPISDTVIRKAQPQSKPFRLFDGAGMYLEIAPSGGKWWRLKYRIAGKEKRLSLGVYPEVTLREARQRRDDARRMLRNGIDPSAAKQTEKREAKLTEVNAFERVARDWIEHQSPRWEAQTKKRIVDSLDKDVFPVIGTTQITELKLRDITSVIQAIEARGAGETASRVMQRIGDVFRFALMIERIETNPIAGMRPSDVLRPRHVQHRAALPEREVPSFFRGWTPTRAILRSPTRFACCCSLRRVPASCAGRGGTRLTHRTPRGESRLSG